MASELRVNTLKDASGNNSIATSFVAQGSAKVWINFSGSAATGTADLTGVSDSFNVTSLVDNDTGDHTVNYTNAMNTANYATVDYTAFQGTGRIFNNRMTGSSNKTAGSIQVATGFVSATDGSLGAEDTNENNYANWGDLA